MKKKSIYRSLSCLLAGIFLFGFAGCGTHKTQLTTSSRTKAAIVGSQDTLTSEQQRRFDYFFTEAVRQKGKGELAAAMDLYEHCLQINPNSSATLYELGHFYIFLDSEEQGRSCLERAVELDSDNFWYKQTLAAYYESKDSVDKAISVYEQMAGQYPDRSEILMQLIELYNQNKDHENVISALNRLETLEGKSEQISMEKFRQYLEMEQDENAYHELENLAKEYPNDLRYTILLGDTYLSNGKSKQAYDIYTKVLNQEPDNPSAQLSLANYYGKMGQDSLYHKELDNVLMNKNLNSETRLNLMRKIIIENEQSTKRDSTQVLDLFQRMLNLPQDDADMSMLCAQYMIAKKVPETEVKAVLNKILKIEPDNAAARLQLLSYAARKEDYDAVIEICKPALEYNPEAMQFYYYLGIAYYQQKKEDEALGVLTKGIEQKTDESDKKVISDFYAMIGDIHHQKGDNEQAFAAYDSSLVYNADNIGALNNYAYYLSMEKKNLDKAEEMSYKTIQMEPGNDTYLDTYAWILFEKKRYAEACIYIDQAMQNGGDKSSVIVEHCGDIHFMAGDKDTALKYWKQAAGMENESKTLKRKIEKRTYIAK